MSGVAGQIQCLILKGKFRFYIGNNCDLRSSSHRFWDIRDLVFFKPEVTERRYNRQVASQVK